MNETSLNNNQVRYAGFGMRMLASVIDTIVSGIVIFPAVQIFYKIYGRNELQEAFAKGTLNPESISREQWIDILSYQILSFTWQTFFLAIAVIVFWVYKSATPGKMLLRMKIVDSKTGGQPSKGQLIIRYLGYFVSVLPIFLGFVWIYYDKKHQGFHDKMARTVVIYK